MSKWIVALGFVLIGILGYVFGYSQGKAYEEYKIVRIVDGDTLGVINLRNGQETRLRIWAIDAPELASCAGIESREGLNIALGMVKTSIEMVGVDGFGRFIGKVFIGQDDLAIYQIERGLARVDDTTGEHIKNDLRPKVEYLSTLRQAEERAKTERVGIWSKKCFSR